MHTFLSPRKSLILATLFIFIGTCVAPCFAYGTAKSDSQTARGNILYVGGSGPGNYSAIQDAINASTNGDTVFVYQGLYCEHLTIPKSITLIGENRTATIIDGSQTGDVITVTADQVTIRSLSVRYSADNHAGILLSSNHNTITDMDIYVNEYAIAGASSSDNTIADNMIKANTFGVRLTNASLHNTIANNTITTSWGFDFDIYIIEASNNNIISGNILSNEDGTAIYVSDSQETIISNNTVEDSKYGIDLYRANGTRVTNNRIGPNSEDGLAFSESTGVVISENNFTNDGLFVYDAFGNTVTDNTVNGKPLVYREDASHETIQPGAGQIILINCSSIKIQHQLIVYTNNAIEVWGGNTFDIVDNDLINNKRNLFLTQVTSASITENTLTSNESHIFMQTLNIGASQDITVSKNLFSTTDRYTYLSIGGSHLTFSDNYLEGKFIHLLVGNTNTSIISDNICLGEGMSLSNCLNNKIRGNYLLAGCIRVEYSRNNEISGNTVINNQDGFALYLYHDFFNTIKRNTFQNCNGSISLSSSEFNKITRNNFINCGPSSAWFSNAFLNRWLRNYWGSVHLGPKIIHGELQIPRQWPYPPIVVRMIDVDPLPRQFPIEMP